MTSQAATGGLIAVGAGAGPQTTLVHQLSKSSFAEQGLKRLLRQNCCQSVLYPLHQHGCTDATTVSKDDHGGASMLVQWLQHVLAMFLA